MIASAWGATNARARSLREPGHDQHQRPRGEPGGQRGDAEHGEADQQHPAVAGPVADPTTEEQERAERERIPGDDPLQVRRGEVQLPLDGRERDVDDAEVELQHELGSDHEPERQAQPQTRRCARVSRRGGHRGGRLALVLQ